MGSNPILERARQKKLDETAKRFGEIRSDNSSKYEKKVVQPFTTWLNTRPGGPVVGVAKVASSFVPGVGEALDVAEGNPGWAAIGAVPLVGDAVQATRRSVKEIVGLAKELPTLVKHPLLLKYRLNRHPKEFLKSGKEELLRDVRAGLASEIEMDPEIIKLYRRYADNPELIRKWSDLADDANLSGQARRQYIIDNVISANNRSSRIIPADTPKDKVEKYLFEVRGNKAFGDRQLENSVEEGEEIIHYGDVLYTTRFGSHHENPPIRGIIDRTNQLELDGSIRAAYNPINNASNNIDGFIVNTVKIPGKVFVQEGTRSINRLPEDLVKMIKTHSNYSEYHPTTTLNSLVAPFNTPIEGVTKIVDNAPAMAKDANWWEIAGFYKSGGPIKPNFIQRLEDRKKFRNFRMTLPKNLRPLSRDYNMRRYWELHGKSDGFYEALTERDGMFSWESDGAFHANTVAPLNEKGEGEFMKSKNHRSLFHEVDWYNKGITYDDNGNPQPLTGEDRKVWENFRKQYDLDTSKRFYKYVPKTK